MFIHHEKGIIMKCMHGVRCFWVALAFVVALLSGSSLAQDNGGQDGVQYYKLLSTVEYNGEGQHRDQVETMFTVKRQPLAGDKVRYSIATNGYNLTDGQAKVDQDSAEGGISFVVDRATNQISVDNRELSFFEMVNNECVKSLKKATKDNVGKTWKQSFPLAFNEVSLPENLTFTVKAIRVQTDVMGEMVAVRALSEPFRYKALKPVTEESKEQEPEMGVIQSRIGTVYLFDPDIEAVYLSISVFEAKTKMSGDWEVLRHEIATYKTDESGEALDLTGLGKSFESLVKGLRLSSKGVDVVDVVPLPQWAWSEGLMASQVSNICASTACEGAVNPTILMNMPAMRTMALQSLGTLNPLPGYAMAGTVTGTLGAGVPAVGSLNIAAAAPFLGIGMGPAAAVGGAAAGGAAALSGGGASGTSPASPY